MNDDDPDDTASEVQGDWPDIPSAFGASEADDTLTSRKVRRYASVTTTVVSTSLSITSNAKYLALAGVGGAAALGVGTAGIGLAVAGGVMTTVGVATSATSAYKTNGHINRLKGFQSAPWPVCTCLDHRFAAEMAKDHEMIEGPILQYIIDKKRAKLKKKMAGSFGLSMGTSAHRLGKALYKAAKHTKGVKRTSYANILARHVVTHECDLAASIVSELYSHNDYLAIRSMSSKKAGELIAMKMKSV
ncbi:hypothetical protein NS226_20630 [Aureimonas ureilytica]|uniref:Uncharacterized protein n=1 Tax=Aureimonas ureilytica TaxID=401562 RepID=A0A175R595_9HYPH|nr:hypothetical protein [Aureimonas ureilytica]KTQ85225.1 hypothetical protein NS226_20630 [Aureimonas ureilytica]